MNINFKTSRGSEVNLEVVGMTIDVKINGKNLGIASSEGILNNKELGNHIKCGQNFIVIDDENLCNVKSLFSEALNNKKLFISKKNERIKKEKNFDDMYNEGSEGYNPYR